MKRQRTGKVSGVQDLYSISGTGPIFIYEGRICLLAGLLMESDGCRGMLMRTNVVPPS